LEIRVQPAEAGTPTPPSLAEHALSGGKIFPEKIARINFLT
jgi:hypothetical protein